MIDSFRGKHFFLSNFYMVDIIVRGIVYPSVEHYFQAHKTSDEEVFARIVSAPKAAQAKKYGGEVPLPCDWAKRKDAIMYDGLEAKFSRDTLGDKLVLTYPMKIVEGNFRHDNYWGVCKCQTCREQHIKGKNTLGVMLMTLRGILIDS